MNEQLVSIQNMLLNITTNHYLLAVVVLVVSYLMYLITSRIVLVSLKKLFKRTATQVDAIYIAQRALELTSAAVNDGGEVLFIAACPKGVGETHTRKNFYDRLTKPIPEILKSIEQDYALFSHKPYKFAMMIESLRRLWVYSEIPEKMITAAHLDPTDNPQKIIDTWLTENPETKITIVDGANKIALHADPETV